MVFKLSLKRPYEKESALRVAFMKDRKRFVLYPGVTIQTDHWLDSSQKVSSKHPQCEALNHYLDEWKTELGRIKISMEAKKIAITPDQIRELVDKAMNRNQSKSSSDQPADFDEFMRDYIQRKKSKKREVEKLKHTRKLVILAFNLITKKKIKYWESLGNKTKAKMELQSDFKLPFESINLSFIEQFRNYLLTARYKTSINGVPVSQNYKINYIQKMVKGLKQFVRAAIDARLVEHFTWNTIETQGVDVDAIYTDFTEIQAIWDTTTSDPVESLVRDKYVLNCYLGMRYSDLNRLASHLFVKKTICGSEYVVYSGRQRKTDNRVEFILHPAAVQILEKYEYNIPALSPLKFNQTIKRVAEKAGLTGLVRIREVRGLERYERDIPKYQLMSSHAGRRSFCTNFSNEGVAIEALMTVSGHKTEKEFRKYIRAQRVNMEIVAHQMLTVPGLRKTLRVA